MSKIKIKSVVTSAVSFNYMQIAGNLSISCRSSYPSLEQFCPNLSLMLLHLILSNVNCKSYTQLQKCRTKFLHSLTSLRSSPLLASLFAKYVLFVHNFSDRAVCMHVCVFWLSLNNERINLNNLNN